MLTVDINPRSPFKDLFPIMENVLNEIVKDMKANGYDQSRPIVLWQKHGLTILDGHTRLEAAKLAKIKDVPTVLKEFSSKKEAVEYTIKCQRNRRNLTDQEILQCISELDKRKDRTKNFTPETSKATPVASGKSADETAKVLGIGRGKVEKARVVLDKAPEKIKEAVKSGKMSINKAYNKTVKSSESLDNPKDVIKSIKKVINIVKKRLSTEQIREMIKLLHEEGI